MCISEIFAPTQIVESQTEKLMNSSTKIILFVAVLIIGIAFIFSKPKLDFLGATANNIFRDQLLLQRNFDISDKTSGEITLPVGTALENIRKVEVRVIGCSYSVVSNIEGLGQASTNLPSCEQQYYFDPNDEGQSPYFHMIEKSIVYETPNGLSSDKIKYSLSEIITPLSSDFLKDYGSQSVEVKKKIIIHELIECDRNSQCVDAAPYCNAITHKCTLKVEACTLEYMPVCGENGITYTNACFAALTGASVAREGKCTADSYVDIPEEEEEEGYSEETSQPEEPAKDTKWILAVVLAAALAMGIYLVRRK